MQKASTTPATLQTSLYTRCLPHIYFISERAACFKLQTKRQKLIIKQMRMKSEKTHRTHNPQNPRIDSGNVNKAFLEKTHPVTILRYPDTTAQQKKKEPHRCRARANKNKTRPAGSHPVKGREKKRARARGQKWRNPESDRRGKEKTKRTREIRGRK